jgi:hypothetical protein
MPSNGRLALTLTPGLPSPRWEHSLNGGPFPALEKIVPLPGEKAPARRDEAKRRRMREIAFPLNTCG